MTLILMRNISDLENLTTTIFTALYSSPDTPDDVIINYQPSKRWCRITWIDDLDAGEKTIVQNTCADNFWTYTEE
jgi:hypothetical protein